MDYIYEFKLLNLMQQTYATLFSTTNKLQIKGDKYLDSLTSRQFMTMMAILHLPENETSVNNVAKKLGTSKQNANTLLASIERKGYITTYKSIRDKRAINVKITDSGKQVMMECNEKGLDFFKDIFARFTAEELETLWGLLKKLYKFDGEKLDGFEENVSEKVEIPDEYQKRLIEGFSKRQNRNFDE